MERWWRCPMATVWRSRLAMRLRSSFLARYVRRARRTFRTRLSRLTRRIISCMMCRCCLRRASSWGKSWSARRWVAFFADNFKSYFNSFHFYSFYWNEVLKNAVFKLNKNESKWVASWLKVQLVWQTFRLINSFTSLS